MSLGSHPLIVVTVTVLKALACTVGGAPEDELLLSQRRQNEEPEAVVLLLAPVDLGRFPYC